MEIIEYKRSLIEKLSPSVVALGFFDGVHIGHRALLEYARKEATKRGLCFSVFTFFSEAPGLKRAGGRLYSTEEKCELLKSLGVERIVIASFNDVSDLSPEAFVRDVLIKELSCKLAVSGEDFRFGKNAVGDTAELSRLLSLSECEAKTVRDERINGEKISTTMIKEKLSRGKVKEASALLGEPFHFDSTVEHGRGVGRTLGIPTVNNSLPKDKRFIASGVYLSRIKIGDKFYTGLTNIGSCPTFEERPIHAETFILDFSEEIYEKTVRIYLIDRIRDERRFDSEDELTREIENNIQYAKGVLSNIPSSKLI